MIFCFFNEILKIIFLVKGINNKKPIKSVKKPGIINNNAANAIEAPEIVHMQEFYFDINLLCLVKVWMP